MDTEPTSQQMIINPAQQVHGREEIDSAIEVLESGFWAEGSKSLEFRRALGEYIGTRYVTLTNSGSSANLAAIMALTTEYIPANRRLGPWAEVITPALCFPTTISPIKYSRATPVFVDVDKYWSIDVNQVESMITNRTRAVIAAHNLGNPMDLDALRDICARHNLWLIEDNCFVGDTLILTDNGYVPIRDIRAGDMVMTRNGYKKVVESRCTGRKRVIKRMGLRATPDHPIITTFGNKRLDELRPSDIIYTWNHKTFSIEERYIRDIQNQKEDISEFTIGMAAVRAGSLYIDRNGLIKMGIYQVVISYIIVIITRLIMQLETWNVSNMVGIRSCTIKQTTISRLLRGIWRRRVKVRKSGTRVSRVENGILNMGKIYGLIKRGLMQLAKTVDIVIKHISPQGQSIVQENAERGFEDVYNLTIEDSHEFFANGILVHNCDALGAEWDERKTGGIGDIGTSSFYPAHHISSGEGGAVYTNNPFIYRAITSMVNWGRDCWCPPGHDNTCKNRYGQQQGGLPKGYDHKNTYSNLGFNLKMTDIQAAILVEQLKRIEVFKEARNFNHAYLYTYFNKYREWFDLPNVYTKANPSWFGYVIKLTDKAPFTRDEMVMALDTQGIRSRAFFCGNITRQPALWKKRGYRTSSSLSNSDDIMNNAFWIGVHPAIENEHRQYMVYVIDNFLKKYL